MLADRPLDPPRPDQSCRDSSPLLGRAADRLVSHSPPQPISGVPPSLSLPLPGEFPSPPWTREPTLNRRFPADNTAPQRPRPPPPPQLRRQPSSRPRPAAATLVPSRSPGGGAGGGGSGDAVPGGRAGRAAHLLRDVGRAAASRQPPRRAHLLARGKTARLTPLLARL
jgi:hypothetical protein